jgi:hypothetical protein
MVTRWCPKVRYMAFCATKKKTSRQAASSWRFHGFAWYLGWKSVMDIHIIFDICIPYWYINIVDDDFKYWIYAGLIVIYHYCCYRNCHVLGYDIFTQTHVMDTRTYTYIYNYVYIRLYTYTYVIIHNGFNVDMNVYAKCLNA